MQFRGSILSMDRCPSLFPSQLHVIVAHHYCSSSTGNIATTNTIHVLVYLIVLVLYCHSHAEYAISSMYQSQGKNNSLNTSVVTYTLRITSTSVALITQNQYSSLDKASQPKDDDEVDIQFLNALDIASPSEEDSFYSVVDSLKQLIQRIKHIS